MGSLRNLTLVVLGALGALTRQYLLRAFTPTIWDEACTGWLAWALLCGGISLYLWKRKAGAQISDTVVQTSDSRWYGHLVLLALSAAGVVSQIVESRGVVGFVAASIYTLWERYGLTFWQAAYHAFNFACRRCHTVT